MQAQDALNGRSRQQQWRKYQCFEFYSPQLFCVFIQRKERINIGKYPFEMDSDSVVLFRDVWKRTPLNEYIKKLLEIIQTHALSI